MECLGYLYMLETVWDRRNGSRQESIDGNRRHHTSEQDPVANRVEKKKGPGGMFSGLLGQGKLDLPEVFSLNQKQFNIRSIDQEID